MDTVDPRTLVTGDNFEEGETNMDQWDSLTQEEKQAAYFAWETGEDDGDSNPDYPVGEEMGCWPCFHADHPDLKFVNGSEVAPKRRCIKLGHVAGTADPTQTYVLECGHTVI